MYCSINSETTEGKMAIFNAINSPDARLSDMEGKEITIRDIYMDCYDTYDDNGEQVKNYKTIIFDENGNTYFSVAGGVYRAIKSLLDIVGKPTFNPAIRCRVEKVKLTKGHTYKLVLLS